MKTLVQMLFAGVCSLGLVGSAFSFAMPRDIPQEEAQFFTDAVCEILVGEYDPVRDGLQSAQSERSVQAEVLELFRRGASFTEEVAYAFDVAAFRTFNYCQAELHYAPAGQNGHLLVMCDNAGGLASILIQLRYNPPATFTQNDADAVNAMWQRVEDTWYPIARAIMAEANHSRS